VLADRARYGEHVLQVGAAVLVRRRAHGDEDDIAVRDRARGIGGEPPVLAALLLLPEPFDFEFW